MKRAFVTGVTGYIGGSIAEGLRRQGYAVVGVVRNQADAARISALGVETVVGGLDDSALLGRLAREADVTVNAADSDHRGAIEALVGALKGTNKTLVHTSGSSIVADEGTGEPSERVFEDTTPFTPVPQKVARVAIDRLVRDSAREGIRSIVVCPTMIYGNGLGAKRDSAQVPLLIRESLRRKAGVHIGPGLNVWSNVHIEDLTELYLLVIEKAPPGSFFFAENGEAALKDIAAAISRMEGWEGRTFRWELPEAIQAISEETARYGLASNSRVRATEGKKLGWSPRHTSLLKDIEFGSYREAFGPASR
ncbi:NAD-dependent epimerase/dehydratase family protein [Stigmatella sp. ncwal1]|uniref:NAD-dependent epimerase/dehydratase family protein n=1 Tax=Stigmatella ashevillensis TaxID=2995309 RepID=A0ABT5DC05_9BACT|nr:NAD-dependent epimerase/dehydratase family protein [Stigmatella ashevillena]MDC0710623.1 NAD-dependent epimerase/dehydratase family protein [Stigmatella ashevillena]